MTKNNYHRKQTLKKTKTEAAVERLRQAILKGEVAPGEWLRQDELAERFGISPTPIREGLRRLEAEGLVEHIPHRGVKVVAYDFTTARDYYDLRAMLEPYAVQLAASRVNSEDLQELRRLIVEAHEYLAKNAMVELTEANWKFHQKIVSLCGSRLVQDVLARVWRSFQLDTLLLMPERAAASVHEHQVLIDALTQGEVEEAARQIKLNIEHAREAMLAHLPNLGITRG